MTKNTWDPTFGRGIHPDEPTGDRYSLDDILGFFVYSHTDLARTYVSRILSQMDKISDASLPCPGALAIQKNKITLYVNPQQLATLQLSEVLFVLHHEFLHLVSDHISRSLEFRKNTAVDAATRYIFDLTSNLAMDMAANALLRKEGFLAKDGVIGAKKDRRVVLPESADLPDLCDYEYYQERLLDEKTAKQLLDSFGGSPDSPGSPCPPGVPDVFQDLAQRMGDMTLSEHRFTEDAGKMTGSEREAAAQEIRRQVRRIVRKASQDHTKVCGSIPGKFEELIDVWLRDPKVPWQDLLVSGVASLISNKTRVSMTRPLARKWPLFYRFRLLPLPGTERALRFVFAFCIDTSGSMSTVELEDAVSEVAALGRQDAIDVRIWVIEADADVRKVYLVKDDKIEPEFTDSFRIHGRGGTSFLPALKKAAELNPDVVVYYTDGEAAVPSNPLEVPLYWLISLEGADPGLPGTVLHMGRFV